MEEVHPSYLRDNDDVDDLPFPIPLQGQEEALVPLPCPGGLKIFLGGSEDPVGGEFPEETSVITSFSRLGLREESREGVSRILPVELDGIIGAACGIMGSPEQDPLKFTHSPPAPDLRSLHHLALHPPPILASPWGFPSPAPQEEGGRGMARVSAEGQYLQSGRFEWTSQVEEEEVGLPRPMTVRSDPPSITMPVHRRALQLGGAHGAWDRGNYHDEDAQVEVEEEEEEEEGSVYTCIECSIYFKKKAHLLEHMFQHTQEGEGERPQAGEGPHTCGECGKGFVDEGSLASHRRLHQESRQKIMEEIRKLESMADEGRGARLQCPKCLFGTNSSKVFVQHAKSHVRKGGGESRVALTSLQAPGETVGGGSAGPWRGTLEQCYDGIWRETEAEPGEGWQAEGPRGEVQRLGKAKRKTLPREGGLCLPGESQVAGYQEPGRGPWIPEAAVELKRSFRETLRGMGEGEEGQRRQLREQVAVVVLENVGPRKRRAKGTQAWGYGRRLSRVGVGGSSPGWAVGCPSQTSPPTHQFHRELWAEDGEDGFPLDILLMDPSYEGQLEALGLRSEERECPYCPDRFHNGIGLANHVRGHLNRVGVSYNVRHFISAEEVKAIEQNYSFQKKRKKVANFDPSTFSLMRCEFCGAGFDTRAGLSSHARAHLRDFGITNWELTVSPIHVLNRLLARSPTQPPPPFPPWHQDPDSDVLVSEEEDGTPLDLGRPQITKQEPGRVLVSDQNAGRGDEDPKALQGPGQTTCEVCGACFETRKGLSSHARCHLRHLGVAESESSGAPIDLLYELAKQGKLPQDECFLGAKKAGSSRPGSPRSQWGDEDGPLNLTMDGDPGRDTDCQFCGAWFETRKGLSSHARAHLRHLGVTDPDAKGSPINALNSLIKSKDFKRRLSGHTPAETGTHAKAPKDSTSTEAGTHAKASDGGTHAKLTDPGTHAMPAGTGTHVMMAADDKKASESAPVKISEAGTHAVTAGDGTRLVGGSLSEKAASHFKCPDVGASGSYTLSPKAGAHARMAEAGSAPVKSEAGTTHTKMAAGVHAKTPGISTHVRAAPRPKLSPAGIAHPRQPTSGTPPTKKLKTSSQACKPSMESYWSPSNASTPLNLSSRADPTRDICCEFCGEFFENRKGLSSHARSHLRQMGITEWHVNGSPIDTLRDIIRKRHPSPSLLTNIKKEPQGAEEPSSSSHPLSPFGLVPPGLAREHPISSLGARAHSTFLTPLAAKRPAPHESRLSHSEPKSYIHMETKPSSQSQVRAYMQSEGRPRAYMQSDGKPRAYGQSDGKPRAYGQSEGRPRVYMQGEGKSKAYMQSEGRPKSYVQGEGKPKPYMQGEGKPKPYMQGEGKPKPYMQGEGKPKPYMQGEGKPKPYMQGEGKPYMQGEGKHKPYMQGEGKPKSYMQGEGKAKSYIQTELPFKVKVKASPDKAATTSVEACCELCGLYFENRKALASHARAHLRQFGVTEWCVNGSPIETLREWIKQRPQKAGAYLSYIQGGRPFTKKFRRSSHPPGAAGVGRRPAGATDRDHQAAAPGKAAEAELSLGVTGTVTEKAAEVQGPKTERRHSKPTEIPPSRDDAITEPLPKPEEQRQPPRTRPIPSLVPRPPQTSLVKFVGNIYTLKCRFCDVQFQGPLSIQEQWVRHLQHHILEMNFSKPPSPPPATPLLIEPEPAKSQ